MTELAKPLVSICMITYNHESYIAQAIESVLMQQTDFEFELVIGEDCSTDGTRALVRDFSQRYPERIRLVLPERNLGMMNNFVATLNTCHGQYIATLEGDDYWTDQNKLQTQVNFLRNQTECVICFHDAKVVYEDGSKEPHIYPPNGQKEISTLDDLLASNFIPTCSVVFKNGLIKEFPKWYYELKIGDWPLHILNAQYGKIGYVQKEMAVYRVHSKGGFSGMDELVRAETSLDTREIVYKHINVKARKILGRFIFYNSYILAHRFYSKGDLTCSKIYLVKCLRYIRYKSKISWVDFIKLYIIVWIPFVYKYYLVTKRLVKG